MLRKRRKGADIAAVPCKKQKRNKTADLEKEIKQLNKYIDRAIKYGELQHVKDANKERQILLDELVSSRLPAKRIKRNSQAKTEEILDSSEEDDTDCETTASANSLANVAVAKDHEEDAATSDAAFNSRNYSRKTSECSSISSRNSVAERYIADCEHCNWNHGRFDATSTNTVDDFGDDLPDLNREHCIVHKTNMCTGVSNALYETNNAKATTSQTTPQASTSHDSPSLLGKQAVSRFGSSSTSRLISSKDVNAKIKRTVENKDDVCSIIGSCEEYPIVIEGNDGEHADDDDVCMQDEVCKNVPMTQNKPLIRVDNIQFTDITKSNEKNTMNTKSNTRSPMNRVAPKIIEQQESMNDVLTLDNTNIAEQEEPENEVLIPLVPNIVEQREQLEKKCMASINNALRKAINTLSSEHNGIIAAAQESLRLSLTVIADVIISAQSQVYAKEVKKQKILQRKISRIQRCLRIQQKKNKKRTSSSAASSSSIYAADTDDDEEDEEEIHDDVSENEFTMVDENLQQNFFVDSIKPLRIKTLDMRIELAHLLAQTGDDEFIFHTDDADDQENLKKYVNTKRLCVVCNQSKSNNKFLFTSCHHLTCIACFNKLRLSICHVCHKAIDYYLIIKYDSRMKKYKFETNIVKSSNGYVI